MRLASSRPSLLAAFGLATGLLLLVGATTASAAQPAKGGVHIDSDMTFPNNGVDPNFGRFTATGSVVDDGLLCATGAVLDVGIEFAGYQSERKVQIGVAKRFTCDTGGDAFYLRLQIHAASDGAETFSWVVTGGTGDYDGLRGAGRGFTVDVLRDSNGQAIGNTNIYDGFLID